MSFRHVLIFCVINSMITGDSHISMFEILYQCGLKEISVKIEIEKMEIFYTCIAPIW